MHDLFEKALGMECCFVPVGQPDRFLNIHERDFYLKLQRIFWLKGHFDDRRRYHLTCFRQAAQARRTFIGRHLGFADLFTPVHERGRLVGYLVAGPFVERVFTTRTLERTWVEIAGAAPELFDADYASFVRTALSLPVLDAPVQRIVENAMETLAAVLAGMPVERARRALDRIDRRVSRACAMRSTVLATPLIEPHTSRLYGTRLFPEIRRQLGVERTPNAVLVMVPRLSPSSGSFDSQICARALFHATTRLRSGMADLVVGTLGLSGVLALFSTSDRRSLVKRASAIAQAAGAEAGVATLCGVAGATRTPELLSNTHEQAMLALRHAVRAGRPMVVWEPHLCDESSHLAPETFDKLRDAFAHGERNEIEFARVEFFREALLQSAARPDDLRTHLSYAAHALLGDVSRRGILSARRFDEVATTVRRRFERETTSDGLESGFRQTVSELAALCVHPAESERGAIRKRVLRYVETHLDRPISRAELARHVGLSPFHLSRVFRKANGRKLRDEMRVRRLAKAAELLEITDLSVRQISGATGFQSYTSFFRTFRQAYGRAPAAYRRAHRT